MKNLPTQIEINATPYEVWLVLTQFHAYELWNPFIANIKGEVCLGKKLHVTLFPSMPKLNDRMRENKKPNEEPNFAGQEMTQLNKSSTFKVEVTQLQNERKMRWEKRSFFLGNYFHEFILEKTSNETTTFQNNIYMSGFLVNLGWEAYIKHMYQSGLELMNEALKNKVEAKDFYVDIKLADERR